MRCWVLAVLMMAPNSFALNSVDMVINGLKYLPESYLATMADNVGELCEFAATEFVAQKFNSKNFYILRNLIYRKSRKKQLGELDIVVFSKATNEAVQLYEVKCRKDEEAAYELAIEQLSRFKNHIAWCLYDPYIFPIRVTSEQERFPCELFANTKYEVLMPKNGSNLSPAEHFGLSLRQIHGLQNALKSRLQ